MDAILMRLGGNLEMQRIMDNLSDLLVYAAAYAVQRHASMEAAVSEHEAIIAAIRSGDADRTLEAVRGHCEGARYRLLG